MQMFNSDELYFLPAINYQSQQTTSFKMDLNITIHDIKHANITNGMYFTKSSKCVIIISQELFSLNHKVML